MRAFSLVVEGGFCLIAMCGNAHPKLLCSGGCSLVVARLLLSDIGRGRLFDLQQGGRLCLQWRGPPLGAVSVVSTSVVVTGHSSVSAGGLLAHCGHRLFLSCGTGPLSSSGGHPGLYSSSGSASSGGSLWGGCSLYLWHLSLLISFHGSALVVRILSCVTSGVLSLFVAEGLLSMLGASTGDLTHNKGHEEEA